MRWIMYNSLRTIKFVVQRQLPFSALELDNIVKHSNQGLSPLLQSLLSFYLYETNMHVVFTHSFH